MSNIHPIRRAQKVCAHCAKPFRPRDPSHRYCRDCFRYGLGSSYIAAAVSLFKTVPK